MKYIKNKLDEIMDFDMERDKEENIDLNIINKIKNNSKISFSDDYLFYLSNYKTNYINDEYKYHNEKLNLEKIKDFEIDSLYGLLNNENYLENKIQYYKNIIPDFLFPIGELAGGDLICMDKTCGKVYLWIHDDENEKNYYMLNEGFFDFIDNIIHIPKSVADDNLGIIESKVFISDKLDKFLKEGSKKYK